MADEDLERGELEARLEARRELGLEYDAALVDGFADRIERVVTARAEERHAQLERVHRHQAAAGGRQLALAIISMIALLPVSIVLGVNGQLVALVVTFAALVSVNVAHAWQARGPHA